MDFRRSQETTIEKDGEEKEASNVDETTGPSNTWIQPSDHEEDLEESVDPMDPPTNEDMRHTWLQDTLKDVERNASPRGNFRERQPLQGFLIYVMLMSSIIDSKPSSF
jgi:hypothetical protein